MRRHLMVPVLAGLFALLAVTADASACCHKRKRECAPAPCAAPCPPPAPVCEPCPPANGCGRRKHKLFGGGLCHKKKACAPVCATGPVIMPSGQVPSGQM